MRKMVQVRGLNSDPEFVLMAMVAEVIGDYFRAIAKIGSKGSEFPIILEQDARMVNENKFRVELMLHRLKLEQIKLEDSLEEGESRTRKKVQELAYRRNHESK